MIKQQHLSSFLFSGSLIILPFFSTEKFVISLLSLFSTYCICLVKYCKYDASSFYLNSISNKYEILQLNVDTFLSKLVYISDKKKIFYEKSKEIEEKILILKEENVHIPLKIQSLTPLISNINIFMCIHNKYI